MNTDNLTNDIIGKYIPNVLTEVEGEKPLAEKLAPFIESAKLWLETEYLGPDDFLSDSHNEFAQKIIVKKAFADAVPSLDLIITPNGMAVINTDNMAPASKERVERLVASLRDYVRVNVSLLLDFCHSYEAWRMSEIGRYFCGSFINSPKDCDDAHLDISFEEARRRAIMFESALAERYIGRETMNAIRTDFNSCVISQSHPLVTLIRSILVYVIAPDKFFVNQNHVWHAARPVLNELNYHPKYKDLWESEMGGNFKTAGFINNVKGGFFF